MFTLKILFEDHVIQENGLRNLSIGGETAGWALNIRFGYYRSLALSCIDTFALSIDGATVDPERVLFCLNGKRFRIDQLKDQYTEYWYLLDEAVLEVDQACGLSEGEHVVELTLLFRSPYMLTGPNRAYARIDSSDRRTVALSATQERA